MEAVEDLLSDYDLILASLDAEAALISEKVQILEAKIKVHKPAYEKVYGYQRLVEYKNEIHFHELIKLTYQQYQDNLHEKLKILKRRET
jgi:hypothetical protein